MKVLAIIPARGGSKGIPRKNLKKLAGTPLIEYTIQSAKNSALINRVIVSTDDDKIAKFAHRKGAEIPFKRPKKYARDSSSQFDVIKHALDFLEKEEEYTPDIVVVLHPTSPLRNSKRIDRSIKKLKETKADTVLGILKIKTHPHRALKMKGKFLKNIREDYLKFYQRQKYPPLFYPDGDIYTFWFKTYKKYNSIYGPKILPLLPLKDEIILDVDSPFDLFLAEMTMLYWEKYKKKFEKENQ